MAHKISPLSPTQIRQLVTVGSCLSIACILVYLVVDKRTSVPSKNGECESAPEISLFSQSSSETIHDIMRIHLQASENTALNFSDPSLHSKVVWPVSTPVIVPAVYEEYDNYFPPWLLRWPVWIYQRKFEDQPLFCPNHGHEGGVYLKFIVDFYDNLPEKIAFIQATPEEHFTGWEGMVRCLKPEVTFTTVAPVFYLVRNHAYWREYVHDEPLIQDVGNCWKNLARAFHEEYKIGASMAAYGKQMYVVSRSVIRKRTHLEYIRAFNIITARDDVCHAKNMEWDDDGKVILPAAPARISDAKKVQAEAMEHLFHWLVGSQPLMMPEGSPNFVCDVCLGKSQCPISPCLEEKI